MSNNQDSGPPETDLRIDLGGFRIAGPYTFGRDPQFGGRDCFRIASVNFDNRPKDFASTLIGRLHGRPSDYQVSVRHPELPPPPSDPVACVRLIRQSILEIIAHEVDEHLRINGQRVHNPHPEQATGERFWLADEERSEV